MTPDATRDLLITLIFCVIIVAPTLAIFFVMMRPDVTPAMVRAELTRALDPVAQESYYQGYLAQAIDAPPTVSRDEESAYRIGFHHAHTKDLTDYDIPVRFDEAARDAYVMGFEEAKSRHAAYDDAVAA